MQKVSFSKLPNERDVGDATKFSFFRAKRTPPVAKVFARSSKIKADDSKSPNERAMSWLEFIQQKHPWKNLKVVEDGWSEVGGVKAYWLIEEHKWNGHTPIKQKVYSIHNNGNAYLFRNMCKKENYEPTIGEFENWIQTIQFIE